MPPKQDPPSQNPRTQAKNRWLAKCRLDPAKANHLSELRRKYYEQNIEQERATALARYYRKKEAAAAAAAAQVTPSSGSDTPGS